MTSHRDQILDYLGNRLSEDDREAFEIALLEDGELQSAVMIDQALKKELGNVVQAESVYPRNRARKNLVTGWAIAASLCLCVSLAFNLVRQSESQIASIDDIVYLEPMRSSGEQTYRINVKATTLLSIAVSDPRVSEVEVVFRGVEVATPSVKIAVGDDGLVYVVVPNLPPGSYQVVLTGAQFDDVYSLSVQ